MGWIVERIVNVDAPATTMSEQVSVEMLEGRRAERNYLLLRDPAYIEANRASIAKARETLIEIQNLSVWISFILPRQVVKPLLNLKQAVDRAAAGDLAIDFDIQGKGEVVQLANNVRNLVERLH